MNMVKDEASERFKYEWRIEPLDDLDFKGDPPKTTDESVTVTFTVPDESPNSANRDPRHANVMVTVIDTETGKVATHRERVIVEWYKRLSDVLIEASYESENDDADEAIEKDIDANRVVKFRATPKNGLLQYKYTWEITRGPDVIHTDTHVDDQPASAVKDAFHEIAQSFAEPGDENSYTVAVAVTVEDLNDQPDPDGHRPTVTGTRTFTIQPSDLRLELNLIAESLQAGTDPPKVRDEDDGPVEITFTAKVVAGGTGPFTYDWVVNGKTIERVDIDDQPDDEITFRFLEHGKYKVSVDVAGNEKTGNKTLTFHVLAFNAEISAVLTDKLNPRRKNVMARLEGGKPPYHHQWVFRTPDGEETKTATKSTGSEAITATVLASHIFAGDGEDYVVQLEARDSAQTPRAIQAATTLAVRTPSLEVPITTNLAGNTTRVDEPFDVWINPGDIIVGADDDIGSGEYRFEDWEIPSAHEIRPVPDDPARASITFRTPGEHTISRTVIDKGIENHTQHLEGGPIIVAGTGEIRIAVTERVITDDRTDSSGEFSPLSEWSITILSGIGARTASAFGALVPPVHTVGQLAMFDTNINVEGVSRQQRTNLRNNASTILNMDFTVARDFSALAGQSLNAIAGMSAADLAATAGVTRNAAQTLLNRLARLREMLTRNASQIVRLGDLIA